MNWFPKLKLLVWKNFLLQKRHKYQTAFEIVAPVVFSLILVLVRSLVHPFSMPAYTYHPFNPLLLGSSTALFNFTSGSVKNGTVAFSPDTPLTREVTNAGIKKVAGTNLPIMDYLPDSISTLPEPLGFKNAKEMEKHLTKPNAMLHFLAGVQYDDSMIGATEWPNAITVTLRFPAVMRRPVFDHPLYSSWRTNILYPLFTKNEPRFTGDDYGGEAPGYFYECFLAIQHALSLEIIKSKTGTNVHEKVLLRRFPQISYMLDNIDNVLEKFVSTVIMLSFFYTFVSTVRMVTYEKELQLKETMTIMGLPPWLHWLAFFIKQISFILISILVMSILLKIPFNRTKAGMKLAVFTNTPWSVLFFIFLLYMIASICFSFLISVFFHKANTAAAFMALAWFTCYSIFLFTQVMYENLGLSTKLFLSLFSNTAMGFAFQMLVVCEATGGLQWKNFFKRVTHHDTYLPAHVAFMFLFDAVFYILLAMYIEKVFPGKYGVPMPWNFIFTKRFWRPEKKIELVSQNSLFESESEYHEALSDVVHDEEPKDATIGVNVKNLTKIFKGTKKVVDNLNLRVYENEITVLLGHNGAGKTTTLSMMTGFLPPTSGVAEINGYNIVTNTTAARQSLGICPQHNVLFPDLTVEEHIYFFSFLKGVPKEMIKEDVDYYVKLLDLHEKRDVRASKLSGGQMRRLSVGAAICGNSKVVLLDEPTSGLDPAARRALWDLLQKEKQGRSIILTTHFMDEADILGDRIAIMSAGKLQCIGTPYFLKKHYGIGYKLTIVKDDNCDVEKVTTFFNEYVQDIKENSDIGSELTYILPNEYVSGFPDMLKNLDNAKEELDIVSYGLTITSLEEVFMKVGAEEDEEGPNNGDGIDGTTVQHINVEDEVIIPNSNQNEQDSTEPYQKEIGSKLLRNHMKAMLMKLFFNTIRNKIISLIQFVIPIIIVTISILISRSWKFLINLPPLKLSLESGFRKTETLISYLNLDDEGSIPAKTYKAMQDYFKKSKYPGLTALLIGRNNISEVYLKMSKKEPNRISYENLVGATFEKDTIIAWFSNYGFHDPAISLALANNAIMRALSPGSSLNFVNHPLPFTVDNFILVGGTSKSFGFQFALYLGFSLAIISAFLIIFPIKERVSGSKLLQRISGVRPLVFWGTSFLWDWTWLTCIYLSIIITLACYQEQTISTAAELGRVFLVLLISAFTTIPLHYLASFVPRIPATGFAIMCFINMLTGAIPFLVTEILRVPDLGNPKYANTFDYLFSPFPLYCVIRSIRDLCTTSFAYLACDEVCNEHYKHQNCTKILCKTLNVTLCCFERNAYMNWGEPGVGRYIFMMILMAGILIAILLCKEFQLFSKIYYYVIKPPLPPSPNYKLMDDDVVAEEKNVHSLVQSEIQERSLVVKDLTKYYKNYLAVNTVNFAVRRGECFGLLGVNGAGKTTTFKMLTGDSYISFGDGFVHGYSLKTNLQDVYRYIGYCPQFDGLTENLTAKETLRIFSLLRGIPSQVAAAECKHLASQLGFVRHIDKRIIQCSGGTKRKISTAVALLGDSPLIFLDEPTSGMDPASKRLVWSSVVEAARGGRSVILTSHSMEECEALCSRLTIMVQGTLHCIGPTQHLKNKFSQGYSLMVKCKSGPERDQTLEQVHEYVTTTFTAERVDTYLGISTFFIKDTSLLWWELFAAMEEARNKYDIEDYAITQTTLEQVFLSFTNRQTNPTVVIQ